MTLRSDIQYTGDQTNATAWSDSTAHAANAYHAAGDAFRAESQAPTDGKGTAKAPEKVAHQAKLLGEGILTGCVLNPVNSLTQLADCIPGVKLPKLELHNQEEVKNSWAGKIGTVAGGAADFVLTAGAASAAFGLEASSAAAMGTSGAINGGLFTPTDDDGSAKSVLAGHLENAAIMGGSGVVMGTVASKVEDKFAGTLGNSTAGKVAVRGFAGAVGGTTSGAVRAETKSILQTGQLASDSDLAQQMVGGAMAGIAGKVQGTLEPSLNDSVVGSMTTSSLVSATGKAAGDAAQAAVVKKEQLANEAQEAQAQFPA